MYYQLKFNRKQYQSIVIDVDELFDRMGDDFAFLDATSRLASWKAPHAMLCSSGKATSSFLPAISEWLGQPVLSPRAFEVLQGLLVGHAELLPVHLNEEVWFVLNILAIEEPVNRQLSQRGFLNGELTDIKNLVFDAHYQARSPIFKINYDEKSGIYCTEDFKRQVENEGLSGLSFCMIEVSSGDQTYSQASVRNARTLGLG